MVFHDTSGNELKEGSPVAFALGPGQMLEGRIVKVSGGLSLAGGQPMAPTVFVQLVLPVQAAPDGTVGGILKTASAE